MRPWIPTSCVVASAPDSPGWQEQVLPLAQSHSVLVGLSPSIMAALTVSIQLCFRETVQVVD